MIGINNDRLKGASRLHAKQAKQIEKSLKKTKKKK